MHLIWMFAYYWSLFYYLLFTTYLLIYFCSYGVSLQEFFHTFILVWLLWQYSPWILSHASPAYIHTTWSNHLCLFVSDFSTHPFPEPFIPTHIPSSSFSLLPSSRTSHSGFRLEGLTPTRSLDNILISTSIQPSSTSSKSISIKTF